MNALQGGGLVVNDAYNANPTSMRAALLATPHTRLPVAEGSVDAVIGVVQARDIVAAVFRSEPLDLRKLMRSDLLKGCSTRRRE